jgi:DNA-binding FrmR family transcriptional regulator
MEGCCSEKKKLRSDEEKRALINRLSRIEGQVRGIRNMLENDAYCVDVLTQTSAVRSALTSFQSELLAAHIRTCVTDDIRDGRTETVDELIETLKKLR